MPRRLLKRWTDPASLARKSPLNLPRQLPVEVKEEARGTVSASEDPAQVINASNATGQVTGLRNVPSVEAGARAETACVTRTEEKVVASSAAAEATSQETAEVAVEAAATQKVLIAEEEAVMTDIKIEEADPPNAESIAEGTPARATAVQGDEEATHQVAIGQEVAEETRIVAEAEVILPDALHRDAVEAAILPKEAQAELLIKGEEPADPAQDPTHHAKAEATPRAETRGVLEVLHRKQTAQKKTEVPTRSRTATNKTRILTIRMTSKSHKKELMIETEPMQYHAKTSLPD